MPCGGEVCRIHHLGCNWRVGRNMPAMDALMNKVQAIAPRYTRVAAVLHWGVALLIIINVGLALVEDSLPEDWIRPGIDLHKSIGLTVLGLVVLRVLWRVAHPPPPLPVNYPVWQKRLSHAAHMVLYGLMFVLPVSGWLHDSAFKYADQHPLMLYWIVPWFRIGVVQAMDPLAKEDFHTALYAVHVLSSYALYSLVALHVLGALKHQWDGDQALQRMRVG